MQLWVRNVSTWEKDFCFSWDFTQYVNTQRQEKITKSVCTGTLYTTHHHTQALHCVFGVNKYRLQNCFAIQIIKPRENSFVFGVTRLSLKHFLSSDVHVANTISTRTIASHFPAHSFFFPPVLHVSFLNLRCMLHTLFAVTPCCAASLNRYSHTLAFVPLPSGWSLNHQPLSDLEESTYNSLQQNRHSWSKQKTSTPAWW